MGLVRTFIGVGVLVLGLLGVTVPAAQAAPPANDGAARAVDVASLPFSDTLDLTDATVDADDEALDAPCEAETTASVWFRYIPTYDSVLGASVSAQDIPVDVAIDVATGIPGALDLVGCWTDSGDGIPLVADTTYFVRVSVQVGSDLPPGTRLTVYLRDAACRGSAGDFDGDGCPDMAVGLPDATFKVAGAGWVEVAYGNSYDSFDKRRQRITPTDQVGINLEGDTAFGAALAHGQLDGDHYADLVIGAPLYGLMPEQDDAGVVIVMFGSDQGLGERFVVLSQGQADGTGVREPGDRFGSSVAVEGNVLMVGVPGEDVGSRVDAGAVVSYTFPSEGVVPTARLITQNSSEIPGTAEAGDQFGSAVAFGPLGMLVIGAPGEDVGAVSSAGAVVTMARSGASALFTQDSTGMAGTAEAGDRLGAAVAYLPDSSDDGYRIAVGVPGEDIAGIRDAGLVNFLVAPAQKSTPRPQAWAVGQDTTGVPGAAESGDRFGSVLATWLNFHAIDLLVGVPDEDLGAQADAGAVTAVHLEWVGSTSQPVVGRLLTQNTTGVVGVAEAGDRLGAALGSTGTDPDDDDLGFDTVYSGVPGEDIGGIADLGFVQALTSPFTTISPENLQSGQRFGGALSREW